MTAWPSASGGRARSGEGREGAGRVVSADETVGEHLSGSEIIASKILVHETVGEGVQAKRLFLFLFFIYFEIMMIIDNLRLPMFALVEHNRGK